MLAALAFAACIQTNVLDLAALVGKSVSDKVGPAAFTSIRRLLDRQFPKQVENFAPYRYQIFLRDGNYLIVAYMQQIFSCVNYPPVVDIFQVDSKLRAVNQTPIYCFAGQGESFSFAKVPGLPDKVLAATSNSGGTRCSIAIAFDGNRPATVHFEMGEKYWSHFASPPARGFTTPSPTYDEQSLVAALRSPDRTKTLEALTWLNLTHESVDLVSQEQWETTQDVLRFWSLLRSRSIRDSLAALRNDSNAWAREGAVSALAVPEPPSQFGTRARRAKSLSIEDVRVGEGKEWQALEPPLEKGEECMIEASCWPVAFGANPKPDRVVRCGGFVQAGSPYAIEGISKGLIGMRAGGIRRLVVPASQALGNLGMDGIPPDSDLLVELHLYDNTNRPVLDPDFLARDVRAGSGPAARKEDLATYTWTCETLDGLPAKGLEGPHSVQRRMVLNGLTKAIVGMRPGGVRRALVKRETLTDHSSPEDQNKVVVEIHLQSLADRK